MWKRKHFLSLFIVVWLLLQAGFYSQMNVMNKAIESKNRLAMTNDLSVSIVKEFTRDYVVAWLLQIDNETIALAGANTWKNETWNDTQGNPRSFDAEWVDFGVGEPSGILTPGTVETNWNVCRNYWRNNQSIVFMSKYNGTNFAQAILIVNINVTKALWYAFDVRGENITDGEWKYIFSGVVKFNNVTEVNRTVYFGNTTDSLYNPTKALYNALIAMKAHNYTFMSVEYIFLIPQEIIPNRFNVTAPFLWYIKFKYLAPLYDKNHNLIGHTNYEYRAVAFPNGTLLRIDVEGGDFVPPGPDRQDFFSLGIMFYTVIALLFMVPIVVITFFHHQNKKKEIKQNQFQSIEIINFLPFVLYSCKNRMMDELRTH